LPAELPGVLPIGEPLRRAFRGMHLPQFAAMTSRDRKLILDEVAQDLPDTLFAGRDDRSMRNRQAERMPEQRRDGEPVRQATDQDASAVARNVAEPGNCAS